MCNNHVDSEIQQIEKNEKELDPSRYVGVQMNEEYSIKNNYVGNWDGNYTGLKQATELEIQQHLTDIPDIEMNPNRYSSGDEQ